MLKWKLLPKELSVRQKQKQTNKQKKTRKTCWNYLMEILSFTWNNLVFEKFCLAKYNLYILSLW